MSSALSDHSLSIRVYYEDTDAGGVVYYANYLKFMERARTEWLRALGIDQIVLARVARVQFVVHSLSVDYRAPARLDDTLVVHSQVTRLGRASLAFVQRVERDAQILVEGNIQICCVSVESLRTAPLPAGLRQTLLPHIAT